MPVFFTDMLVHVRTDYEVWDEHNSYPSTFLYVPPNGTYRIDQLGNINIIRHHANKDAVIIFCCKLGAWAETPIKAT